ncbi:MAG: UbiD family decarboxylase [Chloroflexi bacterium]|nr:UbiD family decarboxylase [Chloroflexota bacterium]
MDWRDLLDLADRRGWLHHVRSEVDPYLEMARVINALNEELVLFEHPLGSRFMVSAGACSQRCYLAAGMELEEADLPQALHQALANPSAPTVVSKAACQEEAIEGADLMALPILTHYANDGGAYITSAVGVVNDPELGPNLSFHRLMRVDARRGTIRLVENRGMHTAWLKSSERVPVALCIGAPIQVQVAASISPSPGIDEMTIANTLSQTEVVRALGSDLLVPASSEFIIEGCLARELADEGPFVDLTRTRDIVRQQPWFVVERITHRKDAIFQALLPGGSEHRLLMGMPREPTIYAAVNQVCKCLAVSITPGGGHWLHAVVQINKQHPDDGLRAIEAAFKGHSSLKHVVVVDRDVDPNDSEAVEWSIATRFQASKDLLVLHDQPSSSLDPSATYVPGAKTRTSKMGLDATIPWEGEDGPAHPADFETMHYEPIDLARFLEPGSCN